MQPLSDETVVFQPRREFNVILYAFIRSLSRRGTAEADPFAVHIRDHSRFNSVVFSLRLCAFA